MRECKCRRCIKEHNLTGPDGYPISMTQMIVCPTCGNKRCPHASDHRLACTGSNESGQPGSVYAKRDLTKMEDECPKCRTVPRLEQLR